MKWKRTCGAAALALALFGGGSLPFASAASAASSTFEYEVTRDAAPYRDIPGTDVVFTAAAGEKSYLWSRNLSVTNVTDLGSGDNVGTTAAVRCRRSDGTTLPAGSEAGAYWAANMVPPGENSAAPALRWVFTAPSAGTYNCRLSVTSYSTIIQNGRTVTMRIPAGAELARATFTSTERWTLPAAGTTVIARGTTQTTLGYTYTPGPGDDITVVQDAALTTCAPGSTICGGGSTAHSGTQAETWIEAQPQNPDGSRCGGPITGPVAKWNISTAKHHQTAANTLHLDRTRLGGCTQIRVSLKVRNVDGNPVNLHAGHASGQIAATHGLAFTH
ncbi:putative secreted protein [Streptomyces scabiei 87.22]|uniref:Putative secreted protein n=2 Tax=Streptomyces scabiei TaxID=1930 RepID=C9ZG64_STRSW|nr:putative secreted protein [Streptomyces scabiei 87.22]